MLPNKILSPYVSLSLMFHILLVSSTYSYYSHNYLIFIISFYTFMSRFFCSCNKLDYCLFSIKKDILILKRLEGETNMTLQEELTDILMSDKVRETFESMYNSGMLKTILPEVAAMYGVQQANNYHIYDVFHHTMLTIENAPKAP